MPNSIGNWKQVAVLLDAERLKLFEPVFPDGTMPILEPVARKVSVPEHGECLAYMLDVKAITREQREKLIVILSHRFGIPLNEARSEIWNGVPILAKDVKVTVYDMDYFSARGE